MRTGKGPSVAYGRPAGELASPTHENPMHHYHNAPRVLRHAAAAAILWLGIAACDASGPDDDVARSLPCNLADEDCAAQPEAADALVVLESMDVDLDVADVELLEDASQLEGMDAADGPASFDAFAIEERRVEQKFSCSGNGSATCCCFWDGDYWGCGCF
jgi:hypothetical protein